jgi:hypothetical protein
MAAAGPFGDYRIPEVYKTVLTWEQALLYFGGVRTRFTDVVPNLDSTQWLHFLNLSVEEQRQSNAIGRDCMLLLGSTFGFVTHAVLTYAVIGATTHSAVQGQYIFEVALHLLKALQKQVGTAYLHVEIPKFCSGWFVCQPIAGRTDDYAKNAVIQRHNLRVITCVLEYFDMYYSACLTPLRGVERCTPLHPRSSVRLTSAGYAAANRSIYEGGMLMILGYNDISHGPDSAARSASNLAATQKVSSIFAIRTLLIIYCVGVLCRNFKWLLRSVWRWSGASCSVPCLGWRHYRAW